MLVLERVDVHAAYVRSSLILVFFLKTVCDAGHIQVKNTRTGSADSRLSRNFDLHCWDGFAATAASLCSTSVPYFLS